MAGLKARERLQTLWRWLEGGNASRDVATPLLLDSPLPGEGPAAAGPILTPLPARQMVATDAATNRLDRAKVARVFDSAHPVRTRDELFGRTSELDALISATLDFGQHAIVHGARGSGKTSLVRVYGDHADQQGAVVIYMACEPGVSFADLVWPYLRALPPVSLRPDERAGYRDALAALPEQFGPRALVELVADRVSAPAIFIFDEFDRITDSQVKADIAAAMKLLSDSLSNVLFMLVGIARSVAEVIESHPSLRRHMRVVSLGRIEPDSVAALINAGERATGLSFGPDARRLIARASCGSPFHVRMFCHHAAIATLRRGSMSVAELDVRAGLASALEEWASMNVEDARRFVSLVEQQPLLPQVEEIARAAALSDRLPANAGEARTLLSDALAEDNGNAGSLVFRDSVAPQFLIAYVILAEAPASDNHVPPVRESANAAHS